MTNEFSVGLSLPARSIPDPEPRVQRTLRLPRFLSDQIREQANLAEVSENQMILCLAMQGLIQDGALNHLGRDEYEMVADKVAQGRCDDDMWEWACQLSQRRAGADHPIVWGPVERARNLVAGADHLAATATR